MFDPNQHKPDPNRKTVDYLQTAGRYCVAWTKFVKRDMTPKGSPFLMMHGEVVHDPTGQGQEKKKFTERLFITEASYGRLGVMCASMGFNRPFDLEDDSAVRKALVGVPFKATFDLETVNGKTYTRLKFFEVEVDEAEREAMDAWVIEREAVGDSLPDFDETPPPSDEDAPPPTNDDFNF